MLKISILDLRVLVYIGCTQEERSNPQMISINIDLSFDISLLGADTDRLEDTVCYASIAKIVRDFCETKSFNLIENLGKSIYEEIIRNTDIHKNLINKISIEIHKNSPIINSIAKGGIKLVYSRSSISD
ncbi:dihydroneopterin aldolase [Lyticum sinuosum]|uniref:dihydroneopterin aldolase n=1 Tax=Lyticum sinuosum TaxID=1332059 RepID=A0AAE4VL13_9RICK|nr:dihydroneopterin aldolase [Lyticum sinuosum]MDZ5761339.1 Dihydroneopterin aldolase [Lyticum sinuosum]